MLLLACFGILAVVAALTVCQVLFLRERDFTGHEICGFLLLASGTALILAVRGLYGIAADARSMWHALIGIFVVQILAIAVGLYAKHLRRNARNMTGLPE